jgi:hypothetical protein
MTVRVTGSWCNLASALDQVGHFRNQGMSASQRKDLWMTETDKKDKTGTCKQVSTKLPPPASLILPHSSIA